VDQTPKVYYSSFLRTSAAAQVVGLGPLVAGILAAYGRAVDPTGLFAAVLGGGVTGLVLTTVAVRFYPVYVGPSGVRSYTTWGLYRTVPWSEIESVRRFNLPGLRYLIVGKGGGVYLPLFLTEMEGFREQVRLYAGASNPLVQELEKAAG
jgi:hypothetical protein